MGCVWEGGGVWRRSGERKRSQVPVAPDSSFGYLTPGCCVRGAAGYRGGYDSEASRAPAPTPAPRARPRSVTGRCCRLGSGRRRAPRAEQERQAGCCLASAALSSLLHRFRPSPGGRAAWEPGKPGLGARSRGARASTEAAAGREIGDHSPGGRGGGGALAWEVGAERVFARKSGGCTVHGADPASPGPSRRNPGASPPAPKARAAQP